MAYYDRKTGNRVNPPWSTLVLRICLTILGIMLWRSGNTGVGVFLVIFAWWSVIPEILNRKK